MELVQIIGYNWKDYCIPNKVNEKLLIIKFINDLVVVANENNVYCYNTIEHKIRVYNNSNTGMTFINTGELKIIDLFNKIGVKLYERFKQELNIIHEVFGNDYNIKYNFNTLII